MSKRSLKWREMLSTLLLIGAALAAAHFEGVNSALMLFGILIFFEVRHPTFLERGEDLTVSQGPQPQFQQIEQLLYEIKMTLAEVKSTVDDVKNELADEDEF